MSKVCMYILRVKSMDEKYTSTTMMIYIIIPFVDYNWWLKRLNTQPYEPSKGPKVVGPTKRKRYYKTLGTWLMNSTTVYMTMDEHLQWWSTKLPLCALLIELLLCLGRKGEKVVGRYLFFCCISNANSSKDYKSFVI